MTDPVTDIDVAEITEIANRLASRENFILQHQRWRAPNDRTRAYKEVNDAKERWITAATETRDAVEKAKKDAQHGRSKLDVLASKVAALQPSNVSAQQAAKLRFEYIGEVSDSTQALLDMVATGIQENIDQAIKAAKDARAVLTELAKARGSKVVNSWVALVNQGKGANMAFKSCVSRVIEELYPHKIGQKLTPLEAASVQARVIEHTGRSSTLRSLVSKVTKTSLIRGLLISIAILVADVVNAALDGGPINAITTAITGVVGTAAGMAASVAAEAFIASATLGAAGPATMAVLGVLGGAIAGMVIGALVGLILDAIVSLLMGMSETSYTRQWKEYMNTPIVYRVIVLP